jgi:hypothetical protein
VGGGAVAGSQDAEPSSMHSARERKKRGELVSPTTTEQLAVPPQSTMLGPVEQGPTVQEGSQLMALSCSQSGASAQ